MTYNKKKSMMKNSNTLLFQFFFLLHSSSITQKEINFQKSYIKNPKNKSECINVYRQNENIWLANAIKVFNKYTL